MTDTDIDLSADPNCGADANKNDKIPVATAVTAIPYKSGQTNGTMIPGNQQEPSRQPILRPSLITSFSTSNAMTSEALQTLRDQGFPMGLAQELGNTKATYPLRFWIIDNSGYVACSNSASILTSTTPEYLRSSYRFTAAAFAVLFLSGRLSHSNSFTAPI